SVALDRNGLGTVKGGTLYPLLARLEQAAHVETRWEAGDGGPGRKYYTITDSGRSHLESAAASWCAFAETTATFLRAEAPGIPAPSPATTVPAG
ncbi:MAG TPA: PadR family transcriptional regulator, partial [Dermatophilaceae bacterium]|nr:PadR family transcriptional regulator [Dermatophilaceae bacterium]